MSPPLDTKINTSLSGTIYYSHGSEVYHSPKNYKETESVDAGFNLQKLAWIEDSSLPNLFQKVRIISELSNNEVIVEYEDNSKELKLSKDKVFMINPPKYDQVDDMAELLYMHEPAVVHNLTERYKQNKVYTYSGLFLVAINPYRSLPIYSSEMIRRYRKKRRGEEPPHIYSIADQAFNALLHNKEDQSILITGESGAGKTENTKIVIQYLASIAGNGSNGFGQESVERINLETQILQANPILEAFGNAQTIRNNNSSRFGKFIRIAFNRNGDIRGAFIDWYLLETSRVHSQTLEERNYHIFYQLLNADQDMKNQLWLDQSCPADFNYTKNSNHTIQGVDDAAEYKKLLESMNKMGIPHTEQIDFFRTIAAILYLGNITVSHSYSRVEISQHETACQLLGIPAAVFKESLLNPQMKAGNEWFKQFKSSSQVKDNLDALAKVIYERNFSQLVTRINSAIEGPQSIEGMSSGERFIGVLDIAGFEIFKVNSFEQLCINYTNEKLQDFFNQNMFVLEEQEYRKENIQCDGALDYRNDLQPTIDLIESVKNPIGVLACLEDECVTQGTDDRLLLKIYDQNRTNPRFKPDSFHEGFSIKHYAGQVKYSTAGWIERGKDPLNEHVARLLAHSDIPHIAHLFKDYSHPTPDRKKPFARIRRGGGNFHTVGYKHKQQLTELIQTLHHTRPHFVRCILPNSRKRPGEIQPDLVLHQLRCNGVLEGIRICRVGFPNRIPFDQFCEAYRLLAPDLKMEGREACRALLSSVLLPHQFQIGRTKVFFKAGVLGLLEEKREIQVSRIVTKIQAACLCLIARRKVIQRQDQDKLIRTIQRNSRVYLDRMQSKLWKVFYRRKELIYSYGEENAVQKRIEDLEQVLAASQDQLAVVSNEHLLQQKLLDQQEERIGVAEAELGLVKDRNQRLELDLASLEEKYRVLEAELKVTRERLDESQQELGRTKELSQNQALMLSEFHKDMQEECEQNESLMIQCDELCKLNQELQEKVYELENDKTISDELQAELDAKDRDNHLLKQKIDDQELEYQHHIVQKEDEIIELKESLEIQDKKYKDKVSECEELSKELIQYKGQVHEKTIAHSKAQSEYKTLESKLQKETEERKLYQKKVLQLERNVDLLKKLVQNEVTEARAKADRWESLIATLSTPSVLSNI